MFVNLGKILKILFGEDLEFSLIFFCENHPENLMVRILIIGLSAVFILFIGLLIFLCVLEIRDEINDFKSMDKMNRR